MQTDSAVDGGCQGWPDMNRVHTMSRSLPEYIHRVWISAHVPPSLLPDLMAQADVIVCQGVKVVERTLLAGAR